MITYLPDTQGFGLSFYKEAVGVGFWHELCVIQADLSVLAESELSILTHLTIPLTSIIRECHPLVRVGEHTEGF
jgi:hypothetical protein